jgi:hypothetical protein
MSVSLPKKDALVLLPVRDKTFQIWVDRGQVDPIKYLDQLSTKPTKGPGVWVSERKPTDTVLAVAFLCPEGHAWMKTVKCKPARCPECTKIDWVDLELQAPDALADLHAAMRDVRVCQKEQPLIYFVVKADSVGGDDSSEEDE